MKFSTRTTYGLRAMILLAENYSKGSLSLPQIADKENLSQGYLERLFVGLKKVCLVKSEKGKSGGYTLAKKPKNINILEIVSSLEGEINPFHCVSEDGTINCSNKCNCGATVVLLKVQEAITKTLKDINLEDLLKKTK